MAFCALPAEAGQPKPLHLQSYVISVTPPNPGATICDQGSWLNCGNVSVTANFTGLDSHAIPPETSPADGNLIGTVYVSRTYGCRQGSKRLTRYDRRVDEVAFLNTRRGFGFSIPAAGTSLSVTTYAFLLDAQPGNCPAGTEAITYEIKAGNAKLSLESVSPYFPSKSYAAPRKAQWCGAVPTPVPTAGS